MAVNKILYFTQKGLEEKQKEYDDLLLSRPDAVKDLAKAREMGDLSENGYYKAARMKLSDVDRRLRQLKHILKIAKVKEKSTTNTIDIGSIVTLQNGKGEKVYEIVGTYEANPSLGKVSSDSPLGKLLIGKKVTDAISLKRGENMLLYTILRID